MAWPFSDLTEEICTSDARSFYVWLLQIFSLLAIIAFCIWLSLRPSNPSFAVVDLSVPNSNNIQNGSTLLTYELEIQNQNKDSGVYYDDILMTFFFEQDAVADDVISSFYQGKDKTLRVRRDVRAKDMRVWSGVARAMANATAKLKVSLATRVRYKTWGKKSKHHGMSLEGVVPVGPDGKISGKKKKKKIKLHHVSGKRKAFKKHKFKV
ncbi:protein NDR1-like [Rhodamnia argentea]|uniref:Protein NDR1-like n=1 Tax=Rhodamnia argentea TaxID=178133 RepID=A0A8B8PFV4_9MYRT|nr:protein NDR1-like [Rhodamnia argentea]